jgi:hypothetical protein
MTELSCAHATPYTIELHQHRFAAWAASRAASSVKDCRFSVKRGRAILEACGFADLSGPEQLPSLERIDDQHRHWRTLAIQAAKEQGLSFTHGIAAKLINVYLKSRFVCGGHHAHERVRNLHPPIDDVLLKTLTALDVGGHAKQWRSARPWSKLDSEQYEQVIGFIRESLKGEPLWKIEEHWKGNQ